MGGGAADLETRRRHLLALRDQLLADDAAAEADRAPVTLDQESIGRLSRVDAMQVQAMALAAQRHRQEERNRVDAAISRIDSGDYGWCVRCGEEIDVRRLNHAPASPTCLGCANKS